MIYHQKGAEDLVYSDDDLKSDFCSALAKMGSPKKILLIPPDFTRYHSMAGLLTKFAWEYFGDAVKDILPALGTHFAMTEEELNQMFPGVPHHLFRVHDWRHDIVTLGTVPSEYIQMVSEGKVDYTWPAQVNKILVENDYDIILSLGQVVPHEVVGMANYNKNIFVGTGGTEGINKSHYLGAVYGMERMMGRADTPVRKVLNYASTHFATQLPLIYAHTVVGRGADQQLHVRGLFVGDDEEVFLQAAELSLKVNFTIVEKPLHKVVVYLNSAEFKSTWLGNKSIYRTRMAIADGGELIVLAPGITQFGEDKKIDELIRKYGYLTTPEVLDLVEKNEDLKNNLSAAAHLIHGSSENRFKVTYCPGFITKREIESVKFNYEDINNMIKIYDPTKMKEGMNVFPDGSEVYYISNPAIGLWSSLDRFK